MFLVVFRTSDENAVYLWKLGLSRERCTHTLPYVLSILCYQNQNARGAKNFLGILLEVLLGLLQWSIPLPRGPGPQFLLWSIPILCAYAYVHILRNRGSLFLGSMQIPLFVLLQHASLARTVRSLFIYCEIFQVCLLFKVQQYFVNLFYHFHDLLN